MPLLCCIPINVSMYQCTNVYVNDKERQGHARDNSRQPIEGRTRNASRVRNRNWPGIVDQFQSQAWRTSSSFPPISALLPPSSFTASVLVSSLVPVLFPFHYQHQYYPHYYRQPWPRTTPGPARARPTPLADGRQTDTGGSAVRRGIGAGTETPRVIGTGIEIGTWIEIGTETETGIGSETGTETGTVGEGRTDGIGKTILLDPPTETGRVTGTETGIGIGIEKGTLGGTDRPMIVVGLRSAHTDPRIVQRAQGLNPTLALTLNQHPPRLPPILRPVRPFSSPHPSPAYSSGG